MADTICIYHGNCADGFTAAWVVARNDPRMKQGGIEFVAAQYGEEPPVNITGRHVMMVDFSYKRPVIERMAKVAKHILILDHHKTAEAELADLDLDNVTVVFDVERSGAQITWDWYLNDVRRPALVEYTADRDLWKWELPGSREVSAVIASHQMEFHVWDDLAAWIGGPDRLRLLIDEGEGILRSQDKHVCAALEYARDMRIGGVLVPVANVPYHMASDVAGELAEDALFGATYFDSPRGRQFSLRSRQGGMDVSAIAQKYGGGGHFAAAGFTVPLGWEGDE